MNEIFLKTADNIKIAINHFCAHNDSVVIICPGWFMTKDSQVFFKLSKDLFKYFDVITMDFRGHGRSGGVYTFTAKEEADLTAVMNYVYGKPCARNTEFNYKNIYLLGFSLGGALVLNYGVKNQGISRIIAVSAPSDFMKIENHMYSPDAWVPTLFQKFEPARWLTIRPGFPFLQKEKPVDLISKLNTPTLFIAGEKDPTVFPWHTELLFNNATCQKGYKLFKNARHAEDLYADYPKEFVKTCVDWFKKI